MTLWTVAHQAPLSMEFSRQEYWRGLPLPSPGDLPDTGIEFVSPTLQANRLPSEPHTWHDVQCCQQKALETLQDRALPGAEGLLTRLLARPPVAGCCSAGQSTAPRGSLHHQPSLQGSFPLLSASRGTPGTLGGAGFWRVSPAWHPSTSLPSGEP